MPRLQPREHLVNALERPAVVGREPGQHDVLLDVQGAEDAAILVHELHAAARDRMALEAGDLLAVEDDRAVARSDHAHERILSRALAGAVAAEQRHHHVALDAKRDVEEDMAVAIIGVQAGDFEEAHSAANTPCTPPR